MEIISSLRQWLVERAEIEYQRSRPDGSHPYESGIHTGRIGAFADTIVELDALTGQASVKYDSHYRNESIVAETWSSERPTESGYYWFYIPLSWEIVLLRVRQSVSPTNEPFYYLDGEPFWADQVEGGQWMPAVLPAEPSYVPNIPS